MEQKIVRVSTEPLRQFFNRRKLNKFLDDGWKIKETNSVTQKLMGSQLNYVDYVLERD